MSVLSLLPRSKAKIAIVLLAIILTGLVWYSAQIHLTVSSSSSSVSDNNKLTSPIIAIQKSPGTPSPTVVTVLEPHSESTTVSTSAPYLPIAPKGNVNKAKVSNISWDQFSQLPMNDNVSWKQRRAKKDFRPLNPAFNPALMCSDTMVKQLRTPRLSEEDFSWCKWAISKEGGKVVVGKSWGKLTGKHDQSRFDMLNCNAVQNGKNPTCDDSWGDVHIANWRKSRIPKYSCDANRKSKVECVRNDNNDKFCVIENAQVDFSKYRKQERSTGTPSKKWQNNFLSADCMSRPSAPEGFPFSHLYSPAVSSQQCDYVHNGTVLLFSHDDIRNLGHTLNDIFNVWIMMWMTGYARDSHSLNMLNIDSFKLGHNFDDKPNAFFLPYEKNLNSIMKGVDFGSSTLCVQRLIVQPVPPRFFIWESWFTDMPCSFIGPSSLYQRWNMHVRHSYGLLPDSSTHRLNRRPQVLLVVRNEKTNLWGSSRTSRNFLNKDAITAGLKSALDAIVPEIGSYSLVVQELSLLSLEEQLQLIAESSIMVGTHGAGMASSMHMSIGTAWCCGVVEVYPKGEFSPIKGHGNMVRKMGLRYDRLDADQASSRGDGVEVDSAALGKLVADMVLSLQKEPTCVLPDALNDPFLESIL
jgi:hypothetical protein